MSGSVICQTCALFIEIRDEVTVDAPFEMAEATDRPTDRLGSTNTHKLTTGTNIRDHLRVMIQPAGRVGLGQEVFKI